MANLQTFPWVSYLTRKSITEILFYVKGKYHMLFGIILLAVIIFLELYALLMHVAEAAACNGILCVKSRLKINEVSVNKLMFSFSVVIKFFWGIVILISKAVLSKNYV
jgi:hypothetical protein